MRRIAMVALVALLGATAAHAAGKAAARHMALPDVTGTVPAGWTPVALGGMSARFRMAQYRLPRAAGDPADPEVIVYYFRPGGGGGTVAANLERWKGQFEPPAGQAAKTATRTRDGVRITTIDLHGTYKERATPLSPTFTPRANYRMIAAAVETTRPGGQGPYWIRLVGPAKSVAAQRSAWDAFLASLRPK